MLNGRIRFVLPILALLAIAGAVAWRLSEAPPSWYRPPDAAEPPIVQLADDVEYRLVEEAHRLRPDDEPFTVRLREDHVNAWLTARLPRWVAGRGMDWPSALGTPQARFTAGGIDLACDVQTQAGRGGRRYVVVRLEPMMKDNQLVLSVRRVSLGRLSLGSASAEGLLALLSPQKKAELVESEFGSWLVDALRGTSPVEPLVPLTDGRVVRVRAVALNTGSVDVTLVSSVSRDQERSEGGQMPSD